MPKVIRLLSIEDDLDDVYIIKTLLAQDARAEFEFEYAQSIAEASEKLRQDTYDVALLDLSLPDSEGLETVKNLVCQFPELPIIVVTDHDSVEFENRIIESGADDFLAKGDLSNRLLSRVIRLSIERKQLLMKVADAALHDPLTGLLSRQSFYQHLSAMIAQSERAERNIALGFIDLDKFKEVNDTYGHRVGDELLAAFGVYLKQKKRESDLAARLGGDEFAIAFTDYEDFSKLQSFIERWFPGENFSHPIEIDGKVVDIAIGYSIGLKEWHKGVTVDQLIEHADHAMYSRKRSK